MRSVLAWGKLFSYGMQEQVVFQGYVRVSHLSEKIKKITLHNNSLSPKHHFSRV